MKDAFLSVTCADVAEVVKIEDSISKFRNTVYICKNAFVRFWKRLVSKIRLAIIIAAPRVLYVINYELREF